MSGRQLYIDIIFDFNDIAEKEAFASFYSGINQNKDEETGRFWARIRLETTWNNRAYEVSSALYWVLTKDKINFGDDITSRNKNNTPIKIKVENYKGEKLTLFIFKQPGMLKVF